MPPSNKRARQLRKHIEERKYIWISCCLCDSLHIGRDKEGAYELSIDNAEELLNGIASYKAVYTPVLTNKL